MYQPGFQLPGQGEMLFHAYDVNRDGFIDKLEFQFIAGKVDANATFKFEEKLDPDVEVVEVLAQMTPFDLQSMTKAQESWIYTVHSDPALIGLRSWTNATVPSQLYNANNFRSFLPDSDTVEVGQIYPVVGKNTYFLEHLSSTRYFPPRPEGKEVLLYRLLAQFHPHPFVHMRFPPQGTSAIIRAQNNEYLDIVFRCHAEFQLNEPPHFPFWFTPAQFAGRLIIKRDASHVRYFNMFLPANKSLNIDMEWQVGPGEMSEKDPSDEESSFQGNNEVDIGYMAELSLSTSGPSHLQSDQNPTEAKDDEDITWSSFISVEEARDQLEEHFYPFKKVPYLSFKDSFSKAKSEKKPVHQILLWGSLDDQSC